MRSSTLLLIFAQFVTTGAKFVLFVILTQVGGFAVAGSYTYALSIITPTFILFGFSLRPIYVTAPSKVLFGQFLFLRLILGFSGTLAVLGIAVVTRPEMLSLFLVMSLYRYVESLIDIQIAYFQRHSRITLMAGSTLLSALLSTSAIAVTFWISRDLVFSVIIGCVLKFLVYVFLSRITVGSKQDKKLTIPDWGASFETLKNGLFLSISAFAVSFGVSLPVLILGNTHDNASVGAYSSIYNVSAVSNILYGAVSQAELRNFAELVAQSKFQTFMQRARRFGCALSSVGFLGTVLLYFWGPQIFEIVFGQDFSAYRVALVVMGLTMSIAPFGFFLDIQLTALQQFSVQTKISIVTLSFTAVCGLILVPNLSILGATLTVFLTMLVRNVCKSW